MRKWRRGGRRVHRWIHLIKRQAGAVSCIMAGHPSVTVGTLATVDDDHETWTVFSKLNQTVFTHRRVAATCLPLTAPVGPF